MRLIALERRFERAVLKTYKIMSSTWGMVVGFHPPLLPKQGWGEGAMLCFRAGGHSAPLLFLWGLSLHSPQLQPRAWGGQPQRAWRMASTCRVLSCTLLQNLCELEASFRRQILKTVATSFILCDYSHLLPQIKAARIYGSPTWDKRNRGASRYGTDADTKARQSQSPPQTCCEEVTHLSRMVRLLSFHCILNYTHVVGQQQGLQASSPRNHSQQRLH